MNRITFIAVVVSATSIVHAQSINSFQVVSNITGLRTSLSGNTLTMIASATPTFTMNSNTYAITEVFGVWALDNNDDQSATGSNQGGWNFHQNTAGSGGISGFKTNPNSGIVGQTKLYNFNSFTGSPENFGYHVRVSGSLPGGSNTLYIQAVPEPGTLAVVGLGLVAMMRRRKKA